MKDPKKRPNRKSEDLDKKRADSDKHRSEKEAERLAREAEKEAKRKERKEAARLERERKEAERRERERREAERREQERKEAERRERERKDAERREQERKEAERRERERKDAERREQERKEAQRREQERKEQEEADRRDREHATRGLPDDLADRIKEIGWKNVPDLSDLFDKTQHGKPIKFTGLRPGILQQPPGNKPVDEKDLVPKLDRNVPLTLLPIRLETVFSDDGKILKIRVYPDDLHIDNHDPRISADEQRAGKAFWDRLNTAKDDVQIDAAKDWLIKALSERRAAYVADKTRPENKDPVTLSENAGNRPAQAKCLPKNWRFVGFKRTKDGTLEEVFRQTGEDLPATLCVDPILGTLTDMDAPAPSDASWMQDFGRAVKTGMGVAIDLGETDYDPKEGIALLLVYGVGGKASKARAREVQSLLTAHRFSSALAFQAQGVATNSVEGVTSPVAAHPGARDGTLDTIFADPVKNENTNAYRLAKALGIAADPVLARIEGAERNEDAGQAWMNEVLWPVTWGQYFTKLMANSKGNSAIPQGAITAAREAFLADVRAAGPLPAIRVGAQPYGVLPIRAHYVPEAWSNTDPWYEFLLVQMRNIWLAATPLVPKLQPGGNGTREEELSQVISVLGGVPHPARMLVRALRDWRTEADTNLWADLFMALIGLVWLVEDDPSFGHEAQSIMGQWGWARAMLGDGWQNAEGAGIAQPFIDNLDDTTVRSADEQIARVRGLMALVEEFAQGQTMREQTELWGNHMIRQIEMHKDRLAPYLGGLPIGFMVDVKGVLQKDALDPEIGFHLYSKTPRELTRNLVVGVPDEDEGDDAASLIQAPSRYLNAIAAGVPADTVKPLIDFLTPDIGPVIGNARPQAGGALIAGRGPATLVQRNLAARSGPGASIAQPSRQHAPVAGGGLSGQITGPGRFVGGEADNAPLLKQLAQAASKNLENGERDGFKKALEGLASLPPASLEWHMRETLGLASNRLDAWLTSLATRRMREMAKDTRAQYGGYGFVLDLKPGPPSETKGFIHAPSMQLATTAGILRSAWLNHGDEDAASPLAINLRSGRLRDATRLFEGVAQGRSVGDILGQDFERAVHDAGDDVALDIIRSAVLAAMAAREGKPSTPPVRGPVDGMDLIETFEAGELDSAISNITPPARRTRVEDAIKARRASFDAMGDAGLAEAVHYVAQGNTARAAGVMDALSLGEAPPSELRHARTDISRSELQHCVVVSLPPFSTKKDDTDHEAPPTSDAGRGYSHPALMKYVARLMPDLEEVAVTVVDGDQMYQVPLMALPLSTLDLVCESARPGALGLHAMAHLLRSEDVTLSAQAYALSALDADRQSGAVSPELEDFEEFCTQMASHLGALRIPKPADFGLEDEGSGFGHESAVSDRLKILSTRAAERFDSLEQALEEENRAKLLGLLGKLACEGMPEALPPAEMLNPDAHEVLLAHAEKCKDVLEVRQQAVGPALTKDASIEQKLAALQKLGDAMLVPEVTMAGVTLPFDARRGFANPPMSDLLDWAGKYAHVRDDMGRWTTASDTAHLLSGRKYWPLKVAQIARPRQAAWMGTTLPEGGSPGGRSWVAVDAGGVEHMRKADPAIVYVIDVWTERLPARRTTTGVAFHFDAPSSRPPQSILLATTPNKEMRWTTPLLERTLIETVENAQLRAVTNGDLSQFGHHLPAIFVPGGVDAGPQPEPPPVNEDKP